MSRSLLRKEKSGPRALSGRYSGLVPAEVVPSAAQFSFEPAGLQTLFAVMSAAYRQLLDATVEHLENLELLGVRQVAVRPETLAALVTMNSAARVSRPVAAAPNPASRAVTPLVPRKSAVREPELNPFVSSPEAESAPTAPPTVFTPPVAHPLPPRLNVAAKAVAYAALQKKVLACTKCAHLAATRNTVVFGMGDPNARILFVGEAPGADEDLAGEPFVGRSGELLTKIITAMGLSRETVYIANILNPLLFR